jgi:hypothetical protein
VESTIVRTFETTVMIVGPAGRMAERVTARFEAARIRVVRAGHVAAAGERLAVAMPQLVLVIGEVRADERDFLADRATAVGALVMHVDPVLDDETLEEILERGVEAALERRILRERGNDPTADVADGWD